MRYPFYFIFSLMFFSFSLAHAEEKYRVYLGTYTDKVSKGIYRLNTARNLEISVLMNCKLFLLRHT